MCFGLILSIKFNSPIIIHRDCLSNLNVFDFLNILLWAVVTLAAVLLLELKLSASDRFWRCLCAQNTLKVCSDLSDLTAYDNSWLLNLVDYSLNKLSCSCSSSDKLRFSFGLYELCFLCHRLASFLLTFWHHNGLSCCGDNAAISCFRNRGFLSFNGASSSSLSCVLSDINFLNFIGLFIWHVVW